MIKNNPYVSGVIPYNDKKWSDLFQTIRLTREISFDYAVECKSDYALRLARLYYYTNIKAHQLLGFNKKNNKIFDVSIDILDIEKKHVSQKLATLLQYLQIPHSNMQYEIFTTNEVEDYARSHLPAGPFIVFNPFGSEQKRRLSSSQVYLLIHQLMSVNPPPRTQTIPLY